MINPGTLVHLASYPLLKTADEVIKVGVIVQSYPPTIYSNRLYIVRWQDSTESLEEEKNLKVVAA
jgi:hypothetical protein